MKSVIQDFMHYAGLTGFPLGERGDLALQFESGAKVVIEPDARDRCLLVTVFHPCPWTLVEAGTAALKAAHYRQLKGRPFAVGSLGDRLVLSARLKESLQTPPEIERCIRDLCACAQECANPKHRPLGQDDGMLAGLAAR